MPPPTPYLHLPGTARTALEYYAAVFGGAVMLYTFTDFGRTDGPGDAVAHGVLQGPVPMYAADAAAGEVSLSTAGLMFALLGAADATTLRDWFTGLSDGGRVLAELQRRPWGAWDGQVIDRYGVHWLIGFEHE